MLSTARSDSGVPTQSGKSRPKVSGKRLLIILVLGITAIGLTAWITKPAELPPDIIIIRPLPAEDNPYQKEYDEMLSPTVMIETLTGRGSGVVINRRGAENAEGYVYILTANHVVKNYTEVTVTIYTPLTPLFRGESLSASVVMTDTIKDLALLRVLCAFVVKSAQLAPKDYVPYLFTPVWVVGCSLGLNPRPSSGCISAIGGFSWEISAPILPGNSGGPVFAKRSGVPTNVGDNHQYEIVGIAVWVRLRDGQLITTMGGIVPINVIYEFLDSYHRDTEYTKE